MVSGDSAKDSVSVISKFCCAEDSGAGEVRAEEIGAALVDMETLSWGEGGVAEEFEEGVFEDAVAVDVSSASDRGESVRVESEVSFRKAPRSGVAESRAGMSTSTRLPASGIGARSGIFKTISP